MRIQVVGPGCPSCHKTEQNVINACAELDLAAEIMPIRDVNEFARLGVLVTPAVIVDGSIIVSGRVPSVAELKRLLSNTRS